MRKSWPIEVGEVRLGFRRRQNLIGLKAMVDLVAAEVGKILLNQNTNCRGVANHSRGAECTRLSPEGEYSGVS